MLLAMCFIVGCAARTGSPETQTLDEWRYGWGSSPGPDSPTLTLPERPQHRNGATELWLETRLPEQLPESPALSIDPVLFAVEVYVDG